MLLPILHQLCCKRGTGDPNLKTNPSFRRRKGKQGNGREGQRERPNECGAARDQKVWEEVAHPELSAMGALEYGDHGHRIMYWGESSGQIEAFFPGFCVTYSL